MLHELGPFEPLIDRVLVMREGRIAYAGPPAALPGSGGAHHHHGEPGERARVDFVPEIRSPFERR